MSDTKTKSDTLRPGFSATVRTTDKVVVATIAGNVERPEEVFVPSGGKLPSNLLHGEHERLAKLGAFDPLPTIAQRGLVETTPHEVLRATAPEGEAVSTPSDIRLPTKAEQDAAEALAKAQEDVRRAVAESQAEGLTSNSVDEDEVSTTARPPGTPPPGTVPSVPVEESGKSDVRKATKSTSRRKSTAARKSTSARKRS